MQTNVKVRVQANGGKYLGPALAATPPTLAVTVNGQQQSLIWTFPTCSSGVVSAAAQDGASPNPIVVTPGDSPYTSGTYYLLPSPDAATDPALVVPLDLPEGETYVNFTVTAYAPQQVTASVDVPLTGGNDYTADPGVVVLVPGLRVTNVAVLPIDNTLLVVTANVAMMCGCAITPDGANPLPAEPYWPAYEFEVYAQAGSSQAVPLACTGTSLFQGVVPGAPGQPITLSANQPAMPGNSNKVVLPG
jgi:hypothetical protein